MKSTIERAALLEGWMHEETHPFTGWDFSYLNNRLVEEPPPWSYLERAADRMQQATSVLDLDTGGGERLLDLRQNWPQRTVATENYPPNTRLAHQRLSPLGVTVIEAVSTEQAALPFASKMFDLVLNRNSSFNPVELARILTPGGIFLTNQVHGLSLSELLEVFGAVPQWPEATPEKYVPLLEMAGFNLIEVTDWQGKIYFNDVGAVVYYLKAIPWLVPNFSVRQQQEALFGLQQRLEAEGPLTFTIRSYLIEARNHA